MTLLRSLFYQILFVAWTAVLGLLYLPLLLLPRRLTVAAARLWLEGTLFILALTTGLTVEIRGRDNLPPGAALVAAKHQSALDTLIFHRLLADPAFVLKRELLFLPVVGWYLAKSAMIAIDRRAGTKALKRMAEQAAAAAAAGRQVVIFPEGTRTAPGASQPYHSGVALLYTQMNVPVVPIALNTGMFWRRNSLLRHSGTAVIEILPPIPPGLDRRTFQERLRSDIETASARLVAEAGSRFPHVAAAAGPACG